MHKLPYPRAATPGDEASRSSLLITQYHVHHVGITITYIFLHLQVLSSVSNICQPRWLSGMRHSHVHSLMIARRSLCPEKLGSNPGPGSNGIKFSGWHGHYCDKETLSPNKPNQLSQTSESVTFSISHYLSDTFASTSVSVKSSGRTARAADWPLFLPPQSSAAEPNQRDRF